MRQRPFTADLMAILGEEAFLRLAEHFGGTRLYVPTTMREDSEIVKAIGMDAARRLASMFAPTAIRVPLARRERALRLRRQGLSNARIARVLGMTETGVEKLFDREEALPESGRSGRNSAQLPLFGE
jgi:hypothetical protein